MAAPVSIFYDLETSDQLEVGQILNYAFMTVDSNWQVISSLSGDIKLDRLQLPRAGAILANRVNVLELQKDSKATTEVQAVSEIKNYIDQVIADAGSGVNLIGYNSDKFDLPFLRTTFIRNGVNPYFNAKLWPKDLLIASRKLAVASSEFPRLADKRNPEKLSLRLENLTQHFALLDGAQTHTSLDDVKLTIDLARLYQESFNLDVRLYEGYEAESELNKGHIAQRLLPNYEFASEDKSVANPYVLLDQDYRAALWIDLTEYAQEKGRFSVKYRKKRCGELFIKHGHVSKNTKDLADRALKELGSFTLKNFFEKSTCDIEADIYRMDSGRIELLARAIASNDYSSLKNAHLKDAHVLAVRFKLKDLKTAQDKDFQKIFKQYCAYRYGGKMQLSKQEGVDGVETRYFPDLATLQAEIEACKEGASGEDLHLLDALSAFYDQSEVLAAMNA